jgi:hypothetical protein
VVSAGESEEEAERLDRSIVPLSVMRQKFQ